MQLKAAKHSEGGNLEETTLVSASATGVRTCPSYHFRDRIRDEPLRLIMSVCQHDWFRAAQAVVVSVSLVGRGMPGSSTAAAPDSDCLSSSPTIAISLTRA